jgi:antitoxin component of RelBE/YafQ-DinJ toxin-antitoxin module
MSKPKLQRESSLMSIRISPDDKESFMKWCSANGLTASEVIRNEISKFIQEGYKLK